MKSEFFQGLAQRVQSLQELGHPLLVSGGSTSTFMLHLFAGLNPQALSLEVIYLQFEHFNWLERESLRRLVKDLKVSYSEQPLSSTFLTANPEWKNAQEAQRHQWLWQFIDSQLGFKCVAGLGWRNYQRISTDLSLPGRSLEPPPLVLNNITRFYTLELWEAFLKHPGCKPFFEHWPTIPFDNIRYWQDYVFKKVQPGFQPTPEWKLQKIL